MELYCHIYSNESLGKMNIIIWIEVIFAIYHYTGWFKIIEKNVSYISCSYELHEHAPEVYWNNFESPCIISYFWIIIMESEIGQYEITKLQSSIELIFQLYCWCDHRFSNSWKLPDKTNWNA